MSYTNDLMFSALPICREGFDIWLSEVPPHCFNIIEMHCLDRVMRQFEPLIIYWIMLILERSCTMLVVRVSARKIGW